MQAEALETDRSAPIAASALARLQQRSDARGLLRFAGHLGATALSAVAYGVALERSAPFLVVTALVLAYGFTLVTWFAGMHESVHRTAFKSQRLNDGVAWFSGLLSFYNSTFYRPYHGWHHRYTQLEGKDPELEDPKPTTLPRYLLEMSGLPWWLGKLRTHLTLAAGITRPYRFLNDMTGPLVVRSVRLQLLVYAVAIGVSLWLGHPYFVTYWLLPVALAQPLLRAILLAEHAGCSHDEDALANTRTTHTTRLIRFLMWEMPYHAEHHRYPALPFFALSRAHATLGPLLVHEARGGYVEMHAAYLRDLTDERPREQVQ